MADDNLKELVQSYVALLDEMRRLTEAHEEQMVRMRRESQSLLYSIRAASGLPTGNVEDKLHKFREDPR